MTLFDVRASMGNMVLSRGRSCIGLALVLALMSGSAVAKTAATSFAEDPSQSPAAWIGSDYEPQAMADLLPAAPSYRVLAVSAGALAGAVFGIVLTSGLATPVGAAAMAAPGAAIAAREVVIYAARTVAVAITATIGGLLGGWIYQGR
jgi:hypothetical protein